MKTILFPVVGLLIILSGCGPSREKTASRISAMEMRIYSEASDGFSQEKADSLLALYEEYISNFPEDSLAPGFLFKAANIYMNAGNGTKSIELFDRYIQKYPGKPKAAMSLFFKAFVYENVMRDLDKAREIYLLFIEKYPNDEFADDASLAIMNLGKTPEMLIREFEERARADSLRKSDSLARLKKH